MWANQRIEATLVTLHGDVAAVASIVRAIATAAFTLIGSAIGCAAVAFVLLGVVGLLWIGVRALVG